MVVSRCDLGSLKPFAEWHFFDVGGMTRISERILAHYVEACFVGEARTETQASGHDLCPG